MDGGTSCLGTSFLKCWTIRSIRLSGAGLKQFFYMYISFYVHAFWHTTAHEISFILFEVWNIQIWSDNEFDNYFLPRSLQKQKLTLLCDHRMKFHGWQQRALEASHSLPLILIPSVYLWYVSTKPKHLLLRKVVTASIHVNRMASWIGLKAGTLQVFWDVALCQLITVGIL